MKCLAIVGAEQAFAEWRAEGDRAAQGTVLLSILQGYESELNFSTQQTYITKCVPDTLRFICWDPLECRPLRVLIFIAIRQG